MASAISLIDFLDFLDLEKLQKPQENSFNSLSSAKTKYFSYQSLYFLTRKELSALVCVFCLSWMHTFSYMIVESISSRHINALQTFGNS